MTAFFPESGFVGRGGGPRRDVPRDWIVWHFTHIDNLPAIVSQGRLLPDSAVSPATHVANADVKERRRHKAVQWSCCCDVVRRSLVPLRLAGLRRPDSNMAIAVSPMPVVSASSVRAR